jgi:hypothetical protein
MEKAGMPRFDDVLDKQDVRNIHAWIIERAHEDQALREEGGWLASIRQKATDTIARATAWLIRVTTE